MENYTDSELGTECDDLDEYVSSSTSSELGISFPPAYDYSVCFSYSTPSNKLDTTSSFTYNNPSDIHICDILFKERQYKLTEESSYVLLSSIVDINFEDMDENITTIALPSSEFYREHDISYRKTPTNKRIPRSRPWGLKDVKM